MKLYPLKASYVFVADNDQLDVLFMMYLFPPYTIGRVTYVNNILEGDTIKYTKRRYKKVMGYNIVIILEKHLEAYDSEDRIENTLQNMANLFKDWRIDKNPVKYEKWKTGLKSYI